MAGACQTIDIDVTPAAFFEVIRDYEHYPDFLSDMESVRILSREDGVSDVEFTLNVIKRVTYTLRLTERPPDQGLSWELVSGKVPWAEKTNSCFIAKPEEYLQALWDVGFEIMNTASRKDFA